jgi:hypothetical protein
MLCYCPGPEGISPVNFYIIIYLSCNRCRYYNCQSRYGGTHTYYRSLFLLDVSVQPTSSSVQWIWGSSRHSTAHKRNRNIELSLSLDSSTWRYALLGVSYDYTEGICILDKGSRVSARRQVSYWLNCTLLHRWEGVSLSFSHAESYSVYALALPRCTQFRFGLGLAGTEAHLPPVPQ